MQRKRDHDDREVIMRNSIERMSMMALQWLISFLVVFVLGAIAGIDDSTLAVCFIVFIWLDRVFRKNATCINE